jgi:hypothetical protein
MIIACFSMHWLAHAVMMFPCECRPFLVGGRQYGNEKTAQGGVLSDSCSWHFFSPSMFGRSRAKARTCIG